MGLFKSIGRGLKKAATSIASSVSSLFEKKEKSGAVNAVRSVFENVAGVESNPKLGGSNITASPYFFTDKEWKRRKRRLKLSKSSRRANRNK